MNKLSFLLAILSFFLISCCDDCGGVDDGPHHCILNGITYYALDRYDRYCDEDSIEIFLQKKIISDSLEKGKVNTSCVYGDETYNLYYNYITGNLWLSRVGQGCRYTVKRSGGFGDIFFSDTTYISIQTKTDSISYPCEKLTVEPIDLLPKKIPFHRGDTCELDSLSRLKFFFENPCAD